MRTLLFYCILLWSVLFTINAQRPLQSDQKPQIIIEGKILDDESQQPIEYATISLFRKRDSSLVDGGISDQQGQFSITTHRGRFFIKVAFLGYNTQVIEQVRLDREHAELYLGTILLKPNVEILDAIEVRSEKSRTVFRLDKRVFNVGKDLSSTGANALEVLNNVPSVNVDIEGEITLRGNSGVQILLNGKPSIIASEQGNTLGTITAEMIDKVEVITNPSAKYDAEGSSGIINIILKKEERKNFNGSLTFNTGMPHNHNIGLSLNRRTEKFNLFSQLGVGYRELPRINRNINRDLINNTSIYSDGKEYRNETFYNLILGTDYHINGRNVLTLSGNFAYEGENQPSRTNFGDEDATGSIISEWYRLETTKARNPKYRYELQYKRDFKDNKKHVLLFSALGNFFGKNQSSEFKNNTVSGIDADNDQNTRTNFKEAKYTFKLDYTKPFSKKFTLETGAQYVIQDVSNDYSVSNLVNSEFVQDLGLTNIFEYHQNVLGIYGTGAYENKHFGIKLGLRLENTDLKTLLVTTNALNNRNFFNLFPSGHISYKFTKGFSLQAGYSRRIYRPRLWDLNPFFNIRNNFSVRVGNPDLLPEFTDSYELSSIYILKKISINFNIYHLYTTDKIERVSIFENNINTFKPLNVGTNQTTGLEFNGKYNLKRWLSVNGDINYSFFNRQGELEGNFFNFTASRWSMKWMAKLKLPAKIDFEITGRYRSGYQTIQGSISDQLFFDIGVRKKLLKGKFVINFNIRDIFASRIREIVADQDRFYVYSRSFRGRFIKLGVSYGFGKGEAMRFSGGRRFF